MTRITYNKPPVMELVLGVQFPRLASFMAYHLGDLRKALESDYPNTEEKPQLEPTFEVFGVNAPQRASLQFKALTDFVPRVWFKSSNDAFLVQFQPDRLICNWRRTANANDYPRYEALRDRFGVAYEKVSRALAGSNLPPMAPNQCEVTYVNHLYPTEDFDWWSRPAGAIKLVGDFHARESEQVEDTRFQIRYVLNDKRGTPHARLIITGEPLFSPQGERIFGLNLSVRGHPADTTLQSTIAFFEMGHDCIVRKFDAILTPYAQKVWEKQT